METKHSMKANLKDEIEEIDDSEDEVKENPHSMNRKRKYPSLDFQEVKECDQTAKKAKESQIFPIKDFMYYMTNNFSYEMCIKVWTEKQWYNGTWEPELDPLLMQEVLPHHFFKRFFIAPSFSSFYESLSDCNKSILRDYYELSYMKDNVDSQNEEENKEEDRLISGEELEREEGTCEKEERTEKGNPIIYIEEGKISKVERTTNSCFSTKIGGVIFSSAVSGPIIVHCDKSCKLKIVVSSKTHTMFALGIYNLYDKYHSEIELIESISLDGKSKKDLTQDVIKVTLYK